MVTMVGLYLDIVVSTSLGIKSILYITTISYNCWYKLTHKTKTRKKNNNSFRKSVIGSNIHIELL